jgi:hypothetical protein
MTEAEKSPMQGVLRSPAGDRDRSTPAPRHYGSCGVLGAFIAGVTALIVLSPAQAAPAGFRVFAKVGDWEAFAGIVNGQKVCGMSTKGGGRWLSMKYVENDAKVTVQLGRDGWQLHDGDTTQASMQLDSHGPLSAPASVVHADDGGMALQFAISSKSVVQFTKEFLAGSSLAVRFSGAQPIEDWKADLSASQKIAQSWASCLNAMDNTE